MKSIIVDTNIVVRYLTGDNKELSETAKQYFLNAADGKYQVYLDSVAIAETIWVLKSVYKYKKQDITTRIIPIIEQPWLLTDRKKLTLETLKMYKLKNLSYIDCWLYCLSKSLKLPLTSFDTKLAKTK